MYHNLMNGQHECTHSVCTLIMKKSPFLAVSRPQRLSLRSGIWSKTWTPNNTIRPQQGKMVLSYNRSCQKSVEKLGLHPWCLNLIHFFFLCYFLKSWELAGSVPNLWRHAGVGLSLKCGSCLWFVRLLCHFHSNSRYILN